MTIYHGTDDADVLIGGKRDDVLIGGLAEDTLTGGKGADLFVLSPNDGSPDVITDYKSAEDDIIFNILGDPSSVTQQGLVSGQTGNPTVVTTRPVYDPITGILFSDPDGIGGEFTPVIQAILPTDLDADEIDIYVTNTTNGSLSILSQITAIDLKTWLSSPDNIITDFVNVDSFFLTEITQLDPTILGSSAWTDMGQLNPIQFPTLEIEVMQFNQDILGA